MLNYKNIAAVLTLMGSGTVLVACGGSNPAVKASEVPAAHSGGAAASCGAGNCGANKKKDAQPAAPPQSSCGAKQPGAAASCGAKPSTDTAAAAAPAPSTSSTAAASVPAPAAKKQAKKGGAQGGCGQGSCS